MMEGWISFSERVVNRAFSSLHQNLLALLYPGQALDDGRDEPLTTLGARKDRYSQIQAAGDPKVLPSDTVVAQRAKVEALDQAMIQLLADQGHLPGVPKVKSKAVHQVSRARVSSALRIASAISISHDDTGRVRPLVPTEGPSTWQDRPSLDSWSHWGTLLHEAAHCTFAKLPRPFQTDRLDPTLVEDLNAFLLGPMADGRAFLHKVLNESFADVYSTMLLDTLAGGDRGMRQEVGNLRHVRQFMREQDFDPSLARRELVVSSPHQTDLALALAWDDRQAWKGQPAPVLLASAQRYASEGLLTLMQPGRVFKDGTALDDRMIGYLEREFAKFLTDGPLVSMVAHEVITPHRSRMGAWRDAYPDHPALTLMDTLVDKLQPASKKGETPYANLDANLRHGAACAFLERGVKTRGAPMQADLVRRAMAVGAGVRSLARPMFDSEPPVPRRRPHP